MKCWIGALVVISVQCIDLPFSSPGVLTLNVDGLHTRADFSCNPGYTLNGLPSLSCNSEGSWSGEPPVCGNNISTLLIDIVCR